jgi:hypothetical protein
MFVSLFILSFSCASYPTCILHACSSSSKYCCLNTQFPSLRLFLLHLQEYLFLEKNVLLMGTRLIYSLILVILKHAVR